MTLRTDRRSFLKVSAAGAAGMAVANAPAIATPETEPKLADETLQQEANAISLELFKNDGLAHPIPSKPTPCKLAEGRDRTLVLGGGGNWYIAWYAAFFKGLEDEGLDMNGLAEMVVGTSAGAYIGSALRCNNLDHLLKTMEFYAKEPGQFGKIAPFTDPNISQQRAMKVNAAARNGKTETIQVIGRAALAAHNKADSDGAERFAVALTGDSTKDWPTENLYTSSNDCYTGERLIVSKDAARKNNIPLARATCASSSLPGVMGPTVLGERYGMDGGMCANACHTDVVAGSKRAIVISLTNGMVPPRLTGIPHNIGQNIKDLHATGTKTMWIMANPPNINLLSAKNLGSGLKSGREHAKVEAPKIKKFWA